jgi:hypothetical protein
MKIVFCLKRRNISVFIMVYRSYSCARRLCVYFSAAYKSHVLMYRTGTPIYRLKLPPR